MAVRDLASEFSTEQAITTGTIVSTNVLDTHILGLDAGVGSEVRVLAEVNEAFVGGTSVTVQLATSATESFAAEAIIATGPVVLTANLVKGAQIALKLPFGCERYLRVKYVVAGTFTAGKVTTGIVHEVDKRPIPTVAWSY